jgi:hypothetical protein
MSRYSEPPHAPNCPCRECWASLVVQDMRRGKFNDVLRRSVEKPAPLPPLPRPSLVARLIEVLRGGG